MGTETKVNSFTENTSTGVGSRVISKVVKGSASLDLAKQPKPKQQHQQQQQQQQQQQHKQPQQHNNGCNGREVQRNGSVNGSDTSPAVVPFVPILIDENNVIDGAKEILRVIRPHWDLNAVQFKKFTDGITNKLVGCFYSEAPPVRRANGDTNGTNDTPSPLIEATTNGGTPHRHTDADTSATPAHVDEGADVEDEEEEDNNDSGNLSDTDTETTDTEATNSSPKGAPDHVVLVRVYGNKTDLLIDRKAERRNIELLHSYGFAPSLYATFKNGLAYDYVPGNTLNTQSVLQPEVWQPVARRMAEMHRNVNAAALAAAVEPPVPMLWTKTQSFFNLVPERFTDPVKHKRLDGTFLPIARLREEFAALYDRLAALGSPLVFAHNDLLLGNVVYTESQRTVNFIDYEYADYNFQAFDIGNHFAEFAGVDVVDYGNYPKREFQLQWLRCYLQTYLDRSKVSDAEVERLYVQVNQFALAAHFFWTIWSLIQAEHSTIDFDYVDYAFVRYNEYLARKDEFLALRFGEHGC